MIIEFDPAKNRRNIALRGLAFDRVSDFDFDTAWIVEDDRCDYGEVCYRAIGRMGADAVVGHLHDARKWSNANANGLTFRQIYSSLNLRQ